MRVALSLLFAFSGLIIIIFFSRYSGDSIKHPNLFFISGILLLIASFLLIKAANRAMIKTKSKKRKTRRKAKTIAPSQAIEKTKVDLTKCQIIENKYFEEKEIYNNYGPELQIKFLNAISDSSKNIKTIEKNQSVFIYQQIVKDSLKKFYSPVIKKDKTTLHFLLEKQKSTFLYYYKNNPEDYWFDLDFLE